MVFPRHCSNMYVIQVRNSFVLQMRQLVLSFRGRKWQIDGFQICCNNEVGAVGRTVLVELSAFLSFRKAFAVEMVVCSWKECIPCVQSFL